MVVLRQWGKYNTASADASMALNRGTSATNQAATSMGLGTTADKCWYGCRWS